MSVVQEDDDESPRCVAEWEEVDDELSLSTSTLASASDGVCPTSHRSRHLRQLVVDLKMELAEALAKVDDLTLANRRLEQERDRAREHIRWLRGQQPPSQTSTTNANTSVSDITSPNRRASDGGAPMHGTESASSSSFVKDIFQSSISNLQDETIHTASPTLATTHTSSSRPDTFDDGDEYEKEHIETLHITEYGRPILSAQDVGRSLTIPTGLSLKSSLRRLSNEICNTIQPLSSEAYPEHMTRSGPAPAPHAAADNQKVQQDDETADRAAGLPPPPPSMPRRSSMPNLRRSISDILAQADRLHQREEEIRGSQPPPSSRSNHGEDEGKGTNCAAGSAHHETYHEYTVKTIFGKDDSAVRRQQRRDRRRRKSLVSSLQIAQARIAAPSSSSEDDVVGVDINPYLPSEGGA